jgi:hypothetical protein
MASYKGGGAIAANGDASAVIASYAGTNTVAASTGCAAIASTGSTAGANGVVASFVAGTSGCAATGNTSAVIGSLGATASGNRSVVIGSGACTNAVADSVAGGTGAAITWRIVSTSGAATFVDLNLTGLGNHANDAAAEVALVPVNGVYRNGSVLMIRVV